VVDPTELGECNCGRSDWFFICQQEGRRVVGLVGSYFWGIVSFGLLLAISFTRHGGGLSSKFLHRRHGPARLASSSCGSTFRDKFGPAAARADTLCDTTHPEGTVVHDSRALTWSSPCTLP
jgi:hypothetical protein